MAGENKEQQNIQETAAALKAGQAQAASTAANVQEANKAFRESFNLLNKMNKLLDDSVAKTQSFEKSTINVKKLQQEQERIQRKSKSLMTEINRAAKEDVTAAGNYLGKLKERKELEGQLATATEEVKKDLQAQLVTLGKVIEAQEASMANQVEQLALVAKMQSYQGLEERIAGLQDEIELEKDLANQVGITGKLLAFSTKYLGVGKNLQTKIVEETRKGTSTTKIWIDTLGLTSLSVFGILKGLKSVFDYIVGIQDQTVKFARALNISTADARRIKMEYASFSISSGDVLINTQKLVEAQMELTGVLGITNTLSAQNLATVSKLKDIAGLEADTRAGLVTTSLITGKSVEQTTKSVLAQVVALKNATGIGFQYQKILREAASQGGYLGLQFAKYPEKLTKSLLTTKALGLELKQLDSMADSFLDFESSISKEFEAQLLTGKNINLMRARELFLNNDLAGAAAEITKQVGTSEQFLNLNRIAADSLASSFGMSRDQLADMLKQQEMLAAFGAKNTKELYAQVEAYRKQGREKEAIAKLGSEEAYQSLINASAQERIAGFIDKIKQSIADFVEGTGIIDKVEGMIEWLSNPQNIRTVLIEVRDVFATIVGIVADLASGIITTLNFFNAISDQKALAAQSFLSGAGDRVRSLGGDFGAVSLSDNVSKNQMGNLMYQQAPPSVNNSMAAKPINLSVTTYVKDTKKDATVRYDNSPDYDVNTGL